MMKNRLGRESAAINRRFALFVGVLLLTSLIASVAFKVSAGAAAPSPARTAGNATNQESLSAAAAVCPKRGGTLVAALPGDIATTDPAFVNDTNSAYVLSNVLQGLMGFKSGTIKNPIPVLAAKQPSVSKDGRTYVFQLRRNVKFQDGTSFNAAAVVYNFHRWLSMPPALQPNAVYVGRVLGFGRDSFIQRIVAVNAHEVRFRLRRSNSSFLTYLTLPYFAISSPSALKAGGADNSITTVSKISYATGGAHAAVGTGPFKFQEWVPGDHVTIVRNPGYWDKKRPACLDKVVFKPVADEAAVLNDLQSRTVDFAQTIVPSDIPTIRQSSQLQVLNRGSSCNMLDLGITQNIAPLNNVKVRQALAYAVHKQAYVNAFFGGLAVPADNFAPLSLGDVKSLKLPTYNPAKARALLRSTGLSKQQLTIDFYYPSNVSRPYMPDPKSIFQAIAADLDAVGFTIVPHTEPWSPTYLGNVDAGKHPLWILGVTCQWAGVDNFLKTNYFGYINGAPSAEYAYKNDKLDQVMNNALAAPSSSAARKLWYQAEDMLARDLPIIPLVNSRPPAAAQSYVKGFVGSGTLIEPFTSVWINK